MFESALRAPDHGRLRPWRFVVVPEEKRERFGEVMADCLRRRSRTPRPTCCSASATRRCARRSSWWRRRQIQRGHKIPEVEQLVSAAAAAENIMLAARAQGFGAMWKTGAPAYDATVKQALGPRSGQRDRRFPLCRHAGRWRLAGGAAGGARSRVGLAGINVAPSWLGLIRPSAHRGGWPGQARPRRRVRRSEP